MSDTKNTSDRLLNARQDMLATLRKKNTSELIDACRDVLNLPANFSLGSTSHSLILMFQQRLEMDLVDGRPDFASSKLRGEVARILQEHNRHLSIEQARYYVDDVCNIISGIASKEQQ